ncbi:MAG: Fic family protein [Bacteroidetes bacterium]|nr:Fic family protein [Bacteroidota bacterium]
MKKISSTLSWEVDLLPPESDLETRKVLKKLPSVHRALAEMKGIAGTIPNQAILLNTLGLQEAKDSSAVENIITTHDELFKAGLNFAGSLTIAAKEVQNYVSALKKGFSLVSKNGLLTSNHILQIQATLEQNQAGFRKVPGAVLKNASTGRIVFTPPQDPGEIVKAMSNLVKYINDDSLSDADPLVKMAVIHFQFESIHPFFDGNGRTGRIINILYLVQKSLLNIPILYLSRYIIEHKAEYYRLLQNVRQKSEWEPWLLFMLDGIEETSIQTTELILEIKDLMMDYKHRIRENYKFYSQELINNLFRHPYTKIEFIQNDLKVSRITASNYLNTLSADGFLSKKKLGVGNYYINTPLFTLFTK